MTDSRPAWAPASINLDRRSSVRAGDYFLGGSHTFGVDRGVAERAVAFQPDTPDVARQVRMFVRRAVRTAAAAGIDQYLDIGAGVATLGPVRETARESFPDARVVYAGHDPAAVSHGRALLAGDPHAAFVRAEARSPMAVLDDPEVQAMIDFGRPVAVLLCGPLSCVRAGDGPNALVTAVRDAMAPGSHLIVRHTSHDGRSGDIIEVLETRTIDSPEPMYWRTHDRIESLFGGFTLLEPGVVPLPLWRPEPGEAERSVPNPERFASYAAVGVKPAVTG